HGLQLMRAAGYQPSQARTVFELLVADADATDAGIQYIYSSHPKLEQRIESVSHLLEDQPALPSEQRTGEAEYDAHIAGLLMDNAALELSVHALVPAQRSLERYVRLRPTDPVGFRALANAYRRSGPEREHVERAAVTLEQAAALAPDDAETQRDLG